MVILLECEMDFAGIWGPPPVLSRQTGMIKYRKYMFSNRGEMC